MTPVVPATVTRNYRSFRRLLRALRHARRGAAALEFAIVSMPLVMLVIGTMSFAYTFYLQFALDYSLQQAVRQIQIGNVAGSTSASNFITSTMCPIFSQFASCSGLQVSVQQVSDYWSSFSTVNGTSQPSAFCTGQPGTLMYARAAYQAPVWASFMVMALPLSPVSVGQSLVSATAFANENPSGALVISTAGC